MECLLCGSTHLTFLEEIKKKDLLALYKRLTGKNFSYLINQDLAYYCCGNCGLKFYFPTITGDEKFYNALQRFDWYYQEDKEEFKIAAKFIKKTDKVLEIGCGRGAFAKYLNKNNYIGIELSQKAKMLAESQGIKVINSTIEEYSSEYPESFDVVCSFQVLEHVSNPKSFIEASIKACKRGGRIIIGVPNDNSFIKYAVNNILNMPPHHVTRWNENVFKFIAKKYNLDIVDIVYERVQPYHKDWFINTLIRTLIFGKEKLIDCSFIKKLVVKLTRAVIGRLVIRNFYEEFLPYGMTMVVVFRRK